MVRRGYIPHMVCICIYTFLIMVTEIKSLNSSPEQARFAADRPSAMPGPSSRRRAPQRAWRRRRFCPWALVGLLLVPYGAGPWYSLFRLQKYICMYVCIYILAFLGFGQLCLRLVSLVWSGMLVRFPIFC